MKMRTDAKIWEEPRVAKLILMSKLSRLTVRTSEKGRGIVQARTGREPAELYVITLVTAGFCREAAAYAGANGGSVGPFMLQHADCSGRALLQVMFLVPAGRTECASHSLI